MSTPDRKAMLDRDRRDLSIRRQCVLLALSRSGVYRPQRSANDDGDLALMRRIDALFMAWPFLGSRRMTVMLPAIVKADARRDPGARLATVGVALEVDVLVLQ